MTEYGEIALGEAFEYVHSGAVTSVEEGSEVLAHSVFRFGSFFALASVSA
jgi:hypothetical protein